jgi:hypothetical protein
MIVRTVDFMVLMIYGTLSRMVLQDDLRNFGLDGTNDYRNCGLYSMVLRNNGTVLGGTDV